MDELNEMAEGSPYTYWDDGGDFMGDHGHLGLIGIINYILFWF